jgi:hypothetical protein
MRTIPLTSPTIIKFVNEPFWYVQNYECSDQYNVCNIFRSVISDPDLTYIDVDRFYESLDTVYYAHVDECSSGECEWNMVAKLTNGLFIYFTAGCDNTGFGCIGGMVLYACRSLDNILAFALDEKQRILFKN